MNVKFRQLIRRACVVTLISVFGVGLVKGSSMTNGSVGDLVVSNGRVLTVNYKGGQQKLLVPEDVPIVNLMPADRSLLKVGVKIVTFVTQGADGTLTAQSISAGKDGVTPPM